MCKVISINNAKHNDEDVIETERVGWTGIKPSEMSHPGIELFAALNQKANEDGLNLRNLAIALDVTYGYIHQLKTGVRAIPQVSDEFIENCARYLKKPKNHVLGLSGKSALEDNFIKDAIDGELDTAFSVMYRDCAWGGYMPLSLKALGRKERLFIAKLYEAATGKVILPAFD